MIVGHEAEALEQSINKRDDLFCRRGRFGMRVKLRRMPEKPGWLRIPSPTNKSEMEFLCQTLWLNYELESAQYLGGQTYLAAKRFPSAMIYISTVLVQPVLLAGERDHQMWRRE